MKTIIVFLTNQMILIKNLNFMKENSVLVLNISKGQKIIKANT